MKFTIIFLYDTGAKEVEHKTFDDFHGAEDYADKQKIERGAHEAYVL